MKLYSNLSFRNIFSALIFSALIFSILIFPVGAVLFSSFFSSAIEAQETDVRNPPAASIEPVLGTKLDPNLTFTNVESASVTLQSLILPGKPALIFPVYYECPRLCGLVMNGVLQMLQEQSLQLGKDFTVITYSINPEETFDLAAKKRLSYKKELESVGKTIDGWNFLVTDQNTVQTLSKSLGFNFIKEGDKDYAHGAAVFVLTKDAVLSQYFTGVEFAARDMRLALVDASMGNVGNAIDHVLLLCSSFDPKSGKYNWAVAKILQGMGTIMILFVGGIIVFFVLKERRKNRVVV